MSKKDTRLPDRAAFPFRANLIWQMTKEHRTLVNLVSGCLWMTLVNQSPMVPFRKISLSDEGIRAVLRQIKAARY